MPYSTSSRRDQRTNLRTIAVILNEHEDRSEFMMDATRMAAEDALLDRTAFRLDPERFGAFMAQLDAPPAPNAALRKLLGTPAPWDK